MILHIFENVYLLYFAYKKIAQIRREMSISHLYHTQFVLMFCEHFKLFEVLKIKIVVLHF